MICEAREWSLRWGNWSLGVSRANQGQWFLVVRRPSGSGCLNTFYPITGVPA